MLLLKRMIRVLSTALLACCAIGFLIFGWSGSGWKILAIPTGSMRPNIRPGSLVLVHRVPVSSLKVGDVITHINPLSPRTTITHRIIKSYKLSSTIPMFITKGDANKSADVPIVGSEVQGKVIWYMPYAGWVLIDAKKPIVILPIVYIAGLLVILEEIQHITAYYKRFEVYRLPGLERDEPHAHVLANKIGLLAVAVVVLVFAGGAVGPSALAAIHSNTVSLARNTLSVAGRPSGTCSSMVTVNSSTTQNAHSGNATSTGGSATSGSVNNSNSTTTTVTITNCS